jgi:hypothetical protein
MDSDDMEFLQRRRQQELRAAEHAADPCSRNIHLELARLYGARLDAVVHAAQSRRVVPITTARFSVRFAAIERDFL